ncbi:restriction endonuclease subunit S [Veillonella sp.]|uniref:restriction endonuclease subunit S n=1 Tax=Veillonella sp. TaxID=1926307 RepID=UPI00257C137B|nr:restriction endonuclease subunit S [Veillonella sp.]MBS5067466.1 restriction endonuclease subunit S [Veillonella sp.]MDU4007267.1 restriction endonuclease subunit S [Veillonella sp.]MDU6497311.1 restriction endonuclease subunit S [Veillonella sp.]
MILSDVCELIVDCLHSTAYDEGCGYPLIRTPNIGRGRLILDDVHRVSEKVYIERNVRATPQEDDLVLAREAPAGNVAIIGKNQKVCLGQRTVLIRPDIKKVSSLYLMYYLLMPNQQYELLGTANGATVPHVNMSTIRKLPIALPDLDTQKRVAEFINVYDNLIENNQKQIKLLEEATQRLYKEWFIDLRFPGHENVEIVDGIPLGWYEDTIDTKVNLLNGFAFKSKDLEETGLFKLVTIKNVQDGYFEGKNVKYLSKIPDKMPRHCHLYEGDLLLSLTGNVGRVCIVEGNNFLLNQRVAKISSETPAYTYCLFRSNELFIKINNIANGAAQQNVSPIRIEQIKHLFPNDKLIMDFERVVGPILKRVVLMKKHIILLEEARDRVLPKLMSGEIKV